MDSVLENVATSLFNGQLPTSWRKLAPATCKKLGSWMQHFERRNSQYYQWVCFVYRGRSLGKSATGEGVGILGNILNCVIRFPFRILSTKGHVKKNLEK